MSSSEAEASRQPGPGPSDLSPMKRDPIMFFRDVLRSGDERFVGLLVRILRTDPGLRERADQELHALPRRPGPPGLDPLRLRTLAEHLQPNGGSA